VTDSSREFRDQGIVFVAEQLVAYAILKFRDRGKKRHTLKAHNTMEISGPWRTVGLFVGLGLYAQTHGPRGPLMGAASGRRSQIEVNVIASSLFGGIYASFFILRWTGREKFGRGEAGLRQAAFLR